jgi:hypothetical protein
MGGLVLILALLSDVVCGALVVLTTVLHRSTDGAMIAVESVRLAEEAQIDLLLHERAIAPLVKRDLASNLRRRLGKLRQFVTSPDESGVLADATAKVDAYLATVSDPEVAPDVVVAGHAAAYDALDALVDVNVADAREAQESAEAWDRLANVIGIGVGASGSSIAHSPPSASSQRRWHASPPASRTRERRCKDRPSSATSVGASTRWRRRSRLSGSGRWPSSAASPTICGTRWRW